MCVAEHLGPLPFQIADASLDGGQLQCGIYEDDSPKGSYVLKIDSSRIELYGNDLSGIRHGFCTLVQIIRLFRPPFSDSVRYATGLAMTHMFSVVSCSQHRTAKFRNSSAHSRVSPFTMLLTCLSEASI